MALMRASTVAVLALALASAATAACTALLGVDGDYRPAAGDDASPEASAAVDAPNADARGDEGVASDDAGSDASSPTDAAVEAGPIASITAGRFYSCARFAGGVAKCWGRNVDGEFGDGMSVSSSVPVPAMGVGISSLFGGPGDTCAVVSDGGACSGQGGVGQLGDGLVDADSLVPVATSALPAAPTAFAIGVHFACALLANGDVHCFGSGPLGQLGNGALGSSAAPVKVDLGGARATAIAASWQHACAITATGAVYCWGDDSSGQLGNGATTDAGVPTPALVSFGGAAATEIAVGAAHSCAIVGQGQNNGVWCWGLNTSGELGDGTGNSSTAPVQVVGISGVEHLAAGNSHTCVALAYGGGTACWGKGSAGQLGNGDTKNALSPVLVIGIGGAPASVAAGGFHTCAFVSSPNVLCWGANDFGQLGNDDPMGTQQNAPVAVKW
jgi:alpha-tubulin suppressor-like RCC1 family protein